MAKKLGERLIESGLITKEALDKGLAQQRITGHKLGDCLVEIGLIPEATLLRFLAQDLKTRFVTTEKLAQARLPTEVLDRVPVRLAEQQMVLPLAWDAERRALSVVMAEPQNDSLVKEVALVASADEVHAFLALRTAIHSGIRRHYYGDPTAFARPDPAAVAARSERASAITRSAAARASDTAKKTVRGVTPQSGASFAGGFSAADYARTVGVLVDALEGKGDRPGHSALLVHHAAELARRLGLSVRDASALSIAAWLHDFGKPPDRHFTLLGNESAPEVKLDARRCVRAPLDRLAAVNLPSDVTRAVAQVYEAYDGSGVPQGARGEEIAIGARVIAAVDAYLELRRTEPKREALRAVRAASGRLFDPAVVAELERVQSGSVLRQWLECDGRSVLVAERDAALRASLLEALERAGRVAYGTGSLDGAAEALAAGDADVLVVSLGFGLPDALAVLQEVRGLAECAGAPVVLLGEPSDAESRERVAENGLTATIPLPLEADAAAQTIAELAEGRAGRGGPSRPVRGSFDELPVEEVLSMLARDRRSGRLTVHRGGRPAWFQLERGRLVHVSSEARSAQEVLAELAAAQEGEFTFDGNDLLMELPNADENVDALLRRISAPPAPEA